MHLSVAVAASAAAAALAAGGTLAPGLAQRRRQGWRRGRDGAAAAAAAAAAAPPREAGQFVRGSRSARVLLRSAPLCFASRSRRCHRLHRTLHPVRLAQPDQPILVTNLHRSLDGK
ncbi:hypothetical protein R5R35_012372 [Gryllus longicercus]|uniref:Accessory gland protein n=1 Tax=Gryllus longicercus TaxID=2509291 RepID=A0AAN9VR31_9ORTH